MLGVVGTSEVDGEVGSRFLPLSRGVGRVPSRVFHFSPDIFLVSLSSILVPRMVDADVVGSMGAKRGSRLYWKSEELGRGKLMEIYNLF